MVNAETYPHYVDVTQGLVSSPFRNCMRYLEAGLLQLSFSTADFWRGHLRLSVPDLHRLVGIYFESHDADAFMKSTDLTFPRPRNLMQRLSAFVYGSRNHLWMYDGKSLIRLLSSASFVDLQILDAGKTTIPEPDGLNLYERSDESLYVEGRKG
jgi:hypothetical protein